MTTKKKVSRKRARIILLKKKSIAKDDIRGRHTMGNLLKRYKEY